MEGHFRLRGKKKKRWNFFLFYSINLCRCLEDVGNLCIQSRMPVLSCGMQLHLFTCYFLSLGICAFLFCTVLDRSNCTYYIHRSLYASGYGLMVVSYWSVVSWFSFLFPVHALNHGLVSTCIFFGMGIFVHYKMIDYF